MYFIVKFLLQWCTSWFLWFYSKSWNEVISVLPFELMKVFSRFVTFIWMVTGVKERGHYCSYLKPNNNPLHWIHLKSSLLRLDYFQNKQLKRQLISADYYHEFLWLKKSKPHSSLFSKEDQFLLRRGPRRWKILEMRPFSEKCERSRYFLLFFMSKFQINFKLCPFFIKATPSGDFYQSKLNPFHTTPSFHLVN